MEGVSRCLSLEWDYEVFVPGRVCILGEHSDWAGGYRRTNSKILPGQVIICGTNQGIYANIRKNSKFLIINSTLPDGSQKTICSNVSVTPKT